MDSVPEHYMSIVNALNSFPEPPARPVNPSALEELAHAEAEEEHSEALRNEVGGVLREVHGKGLYKHVRVNMYGVNGNAYNILGVVKKALHKVGAPDEHVRAFLVEAMAAGYEELLDTCSEWVTIVHEAHDVGDAWAAFKRRS